VIVRAVRAVVVPPVAGGWRLSPRTADALLYVAAAAFGVLGGLSLMKDAPQWKLIQLALLLPVLVLPLTIRPEKVFVGWLFAAPFVQGASAGPHQGHVFYKFLFLVPPLIVLARMGLGAVDLRSFWLVDALPLLYLLYIAIRLYFFPSDFTGTESSPRAVYTAVGIAIIGYYFAAFGETSSSFAVGVARALIWGGVFIALLGLVDAATGWNLWNTTIGGSDLGQVRRISSTLNGPVPLGTYLSAGIAFGVAALTWKGPQSLRRPALFLIPISIPVLYFTYTRGPIVGIAAVSVAMTVVANRARWRSVFVLLTVCALVLAAWSHLSSTKIYKDRLGVTETLTTREAIQRESVELLREKPLFGWGYNTFDQAKLTLAKRETQIDYITSHDTYLTVLVELGVVGLGLMLVPWIVIAFRTLAAGARHLAEPWIVAGCLGTTVSYAIGAVTYDARFFSFTSALPWITLGVARNTLRKSARREVASSEHATDIA
jgi:O-antigen ligase